MGINNNPEYKFEPGSYKNEERHTPSIACLELSGDDKWKYLFMILKVEKSYDNPDAAARVAVEDLQAAMEYDQSGQSESGMAEYLKSVGYDNSPSYRVEGTA